MPKTKRQKIFHTPGSQGVAIGKAVLLTSSRTAIEKYWINDREVTREINRFNTALDKSRLQLERIKEKLCRFQGQDQIEIIESHRLLLQDEMLTTSTIQNIVDHRINAEWALEKTLSHLKMAFADISEEYFQERKDDVIHVGQRIIKNLTGDIDSSIDDMLGGDSILIATNLSPAEVATLNKEKVKGFITEQGSKTSHTAIIARSLEIPAIIGVNNISNIANNGDNVIIDGPRGVIIINPTENEIVEYQSLIKKYEKLEKLLLKDIHLPTETKDKHSLRLVANIELAEEVPSVLQHGAEGIGLYRTEYLFINRLDMPSEDEQFDNYKDILKKMGDKPVTIRTLDLGGDKFPVNGHIMNANPALGLRGIRFSLKDISIFKAQLKALFRASVYGNLKILLPMISNFVELRSAKEIIADVKKDLKEAHVRFNPNTPVGMMVEVPSAAIMADIFAEEVDFLSIGTNDLIQYALAVDRTNEQVSYLYNPLHPAILRLLKSIVDGAKHAEKPITLCGEMAGDPLYILILVGLGIDELSMNPISIPLVKKILRTITFDQAQKMFTKIIGTTSLDKIEKIVGKEMKGILPIYARKAISSLDL
ncbi:phosphoenolpyruvate--protein phosphotransferase [bacterium]|nr:phosphoenolpyruvate--protein phosphotransferase [bacterium]